jgi:hypothetical protein
MEIPARPKTLSAPAALRKLVPPAERTFSTQSALNGHSDAPSECPLSRVKRTRYRLRHHFQLSYVAYRNVSSYVCCSG